MQKRGIRTQSLTGKRILGGISAAVLAFLSVLSFAAPASAADSVVIRKVDTSNMPNVSLTVLKPPVAGADNSGVHVSENGTAITNANIQNASDANLPMGVVLVIDTSDNANTSGAFNQEKAAAVAMVQAASPGEQFAIVATNGTPRTVATFTADKNALTTTINGLNASNQNALWSGVSLAAGLLTNNPDLQSNVVVLAASKDQTSPSGGFTNASAQLVSAKAVAFTVGIGSNVDTDNLKSMASDTGGRYIATNDPSTASQILTGLQQNLADQAVITYQSKSNGGAIDISVSIGTGTATAHASPGTISEGNNVSPTVVPQNGGPAFLSGPIGLILVAIISLGCVALLLYGIVEIAAKDRHQLTRALRPYSDEPEEHTDFSKIADSEIIKKAVAATAKAASDRGLLQVVEQRLEQADLPFRPAEALFISIVLALIAMLIGAVFFGIMGIAIGFLIFALLPVMITGFLAKRRRSKFTRQLPDTLQLLAGSLRAGYSLVQGLDAVSKQCEAPMGSELLRAMGEARLGRPVEEALQEISDRMGSDDFEWTVMAIKIQREVGGNLAELLMTVSETMVARERLRREVKALTAEGRISAIVLAGLPPIIGLIIEFINPGYMQPMLNNQLGQIALIAGGVMIGVGYWLMMKMIQVEA